MSLRNSGLNRVSGTLNTAIDAAVLLPSVSTGRRYNVRHLVLESIVSAAEAIFIQNTSGDQIWYKLPASWPIGEGRDIWFDSLSASNVNEGIMIQATGSGPSIWVIIEYEILPG